MLHLNLLRLVARGGPKRMMATTTKLTSVEVNDKTGIATLTLNRPPVNSQNVQLLEDLQTSIAEIESNKSRGLILTSASSNVFSAGLDITELYNTDEDRLRTIWRALQNAWIALYGSSLPTAAAINGHAPAGGCLLATACEYRVMLPNRLIGLNETQLGIIAPKWLMSGFLNVLPQRVAERALTQGRLFTTEEALAEGLVDEIANTKEEVLEKCSAFIGSFAKVNSLARSLTKLQFRSENIKEFEKIRNKDLEDFVALASSPETQKVMGNYLETLKKKSKKLTKF
ncbi:enoyl-CoA delta isomerase 1, mitochondrial isoform X1 [Drosophila serrata]|uniref:enoyl-CoA delta isomerase 1, mitochondrial isoform X1 n=2 Tax=Drosophila serrata TaxID=7274 RepID=UPI000A1D1B1C|nr:enoyl-CoA delta isomerase 1, mitochondrial isoform X1 [Drosophila serrata]XP_020807065.1 enoyl-CoA delta isomerase 1, mitochondrial isoform X1 [Drosophila serrata]